MLAQYVTSSAAAAADSGGDFSWGTLLMFVGMFLALAVVSSLGFIARIRDRATERKAEAARAQRSRQPDAPSSTG
jgi:hypothetical protein